jgi:F-type H+-transporting ATPase subunit alpha
MTRPLTDPLTDRRLIDTVPEIAALCRAAVKASGPELTVAEIGRVQEVGAGVARIEGLNRALSDEIVVFASGARGIVTDLTPGRMGVIFLDDMAGVRVGDQVRRSHSVAETYVGSGLLGRVVDPLGRPLDALGALAHLERAPIEVPARPIFERNPVARPLATGIKAIDAAIPIGLGQRELIIGDRQTGKTSIAIDTILNQRDSNVLCVYCAIGQRGDAVGHVIDALREGGMLSQCIIVVAGGETAPGMSFLAPYAATTMAEHFVNDGRDVLVVYDDLTRHAHAYRELSLLLRRPPGREAYPGDIFYIHARLLERSGQFSKAVGGGSLTALPILETQAENLSGYIPTNLISITDGQVYLSPRLFEKGRLPAIDLGRSVSRVGGKAQSPALRSVSSDLRIVMSRFLELESFARFGTQLDDRTRATLARGRAVRVALMQPERRPLGALAQILQLLAATDGLLDGLDVADKTAALDRLEQRALDDRDALADMVAVGPLTDELRQRLVAMAREVVDGTA